MQQGLTGLRVLLVDDNAATRSIIGAVLESLGVRGVRQASDGAAALELLKTWPADLAFTDYLMAPMDGVAFTRAVRGDPDSANPYLPIIMATSFADRGRVMEARDAGVTELLVKPLTAQAIMDRLDAVLQRPRPFVQSKDYFGPDRRRRAQPGHAGPWRRQGDAVAGLAPLDGMRRQASPGSA